MYEEGRATELAEIVIKMVREAEGHLEQILLNRGKFAEVLCLVVLAGS